MRVVHLNDVAGVASELAQAQRRLGDEAVVIQPRLAAASGSTALKLVAAPLRLAEMVRINREIARGHWDAVHIHYAYMGIAGRLGGLRYVLHCHGTDVRQGLLDPVRRPLVKAALRGASHVLVSTPDLVPLVSQVRPDVEFLPNPIDTSRFEVSAWPEGPFRVLLISALTTVKRADIALEAARQIRRRIPGAIVTAIYFGAERDRFKPMGEGVEFAPPVPRSEMPSLIARHHAVVGQFGIGSLGMSELEAMASGRPVASFMVTAAAYPKAPPLLSTQDPAVVAGWAAGLAADRDAGQALGLEAAAWVREHHDSLRVAGRVRTIYRDALGAKAS